VLRLQNLVALSTTEAKYIAATEAYKELIWLKDFMKELDKKQVTSSLYTDNQCNTTLIKHHFS